MDQDDDEFFVLKIAAVATVAIWLGGLVAIICGWVQ